MLRLLLAKALRRGLWDGNRFWMVVGVLAAMARLAQRDDTPEPVFSQRLQPGDSLMVTVRSGR